MSQKSNIDQALELVTTFMLDYEITIKPKKDDDYTGATLIERIVKLLDAKDDYYTEMMS